MSNRKILVCEDNAMVSQITGFALEAEGFEVKTVTDTEEVFATLKSWLPDIVLLDLNLPSAGGAFVLEQMKKQKETEKIPVVLFSGESKLPEIAARLNADGYVQKPFDVPVLIETIQKFIVPVK